MASVSCSGRTISRAPVERLEMERVEPVPAGIIEDAVVVGCAAFREDAGAEPARRPAEILERLPDRAPVNGGIAGGPRPPLPNRLEWFCFPDGDVAPVLRRRRPPDSVHWFTLHDERTRPLRGCVLTSWRRCASNADKALWVPTALCVLSRVGVGPALELWLRQAAVVLREDATCDVSLRRRLV